MVFLIFAIQQYLADGCIEPKVKLISVTRNEECRFVIQGSAAIARSPHLVWFATLVNFRDPYVFKRTWDIGVISYDDGYQLQIEQERYHDQRFYWTESDLRMNIVARRSPNKASGVNSMEE
jgi:hypothetical protein